MPAPAFQSSITHRYSLDESGSLADSVGSATLTRAGTTSTTTGKLTSAVRFSGAGRLTAGAGIGPLFGATKVAVYIWVYLPPTVGNGAVITQFRDNGNRQWLLWYDESSTDVFKFFASSNGTSWDTQRDFTSHGQPARGVWLLLGVEYSPNPGGFLRLSVNNGTADTYAAPTVFQGTAAFTVGGDVDNVFPITADCDELLIIEGYSLISADREHIYSDGYPEAYPYPSGQYVRPPVRITSPVGYQVSLRNGLRADIPISGIVAGTGVTVNGSFDGASFDTVATGVGPGSFTGTLALQQLGTGPLQCRIDDDDDTLDEVANVRTGNLWLIGGQSNASGRTNTLFSYTASGENEVSIFGNDYVWKDSVERIDSEVGQIDGVSADTVSGGSIWNLVGTALLQSLGCPQAFIPCAKGATSITDWLPGVDHMNRSTLYGSMNYRASVTGAKDVIFWQGETDVIAGMSEATYRAHLLTIAAAWLADRGGRILMPLLQNMTPDPTNINAAISSAAASASNIFVICTLMSITPADGVHIQTDVEAAAAAALFAAGLATVGAGAARPANVWRLPPRRTEFVLPGRVTEFRL